MKLTEKAKRYLLVLGGILLCAGLLVAIWFQLKPEAVPEERFEAETGEVTEITVDMEQEEEKGQGAQNGDGIVETEPESCRLKQNRKPNRERQHRMAWRMGRMTDRRRTLCKASSWM